MIRHEELRAGSNYYIPGTKNVITFTFDQITEHIASSTTGRISFMPIPLTKEWIVKLGGLKSDVSYDTEFYFKQGQQIEFYVIWHEDSKSWNCYKVSYQDEVILTSIYYVHQLQNLYFALTDSELIKL